MNEWVNEWKITSLSAPNFSKRKCNRVKLERDIIRNEKKREFTEKREGRFRSLNTLTQSEIYPPPFANQPWKKSGVSVLFRTFSSRQWATKLYSIFFINHFPTHPQIYKIIWAIFWVNSFIKFIFKKKINLKFISKNRPLRSQLGAN